MRETFFGIDRKYFLSVGVFIVYHSFWPHPNILLVCRTFFHLKNPLFCSVILTTHWTCFFEIWMHTKGTGNENQVNPLCGCSINRKNWFFDSVQKKFTFFSVVKTKERNPFFLLDKKQFYWTMFCQPKAAVKCAIWFEWSLWSLMQKMRAHLYWPTHDQNKIISSDSWLPFLIMWNPYYYCI